LGFIQINWTWMFLGLLATLIFSAMCFGMVGLILVRLPATCFSDPHSSGFWMQGHPALRWIAIILKNICGTPIVAFGIVPAIPGIPDPEF
jgi:hypothetical protein